VPHGDVQAMVARMGELVRSPARVAKLGASGRAFAERFSWDAAARETEAHLRAVVARPAPVTRRHA
jgi:glycosyltransferase involved in cell wall biosynthesis